MEVEQNLLMVVTNLVTKNQVKYTVEFDEKTGKAKIFEDGVPILIYYSEISSYKSVGVQKLLSKNLRG